MKKLILSFVVTAAMIVGASGCSNVDTPVAGGGGAAAPAPDAANLDEPVAVDPAVQAMVPAAIAAQGTIDGGANFQAPPMAMYAADGATPTGAVVELVEHAAAVMGLTVRWQQVLYPDQIPAMQAKKIVVSGSASAANGAIIEKANVVGAFKNLQGVLVTSAKADEFVSLDAMCGKRIGLGTAAASTLAIFGEVAAHCTQAGAPAPVMVGLSATADIVLAVRAGRVDAGMIPTPTVVYTAQQSGGELVSAQSGDAIAAAIDQGDEGFTVAKDQPELAAAFHAALQAMIDDGSYARILATFDIPQIQLIDTATLNEAS